jgi:hypothetical protein
MKGTIKYVPKEILERLEKYKLDFNIKDSEAFKRMANDSKIGRDIRLTLNVNVDNLFGKRKRR